MTDLWAAIAIALILEGMLPFVSPHSWKKMVAKLVLLPQTQLRVFGLLVMLVGVVLLSIVRHSY